MDEAQHLLAVRNVAGESPIWAPEERAVYWVDCEGSLLFRLDTVSGQHRAFQAELPVTAIGRRAQGGWIAARSKKVGSFFGAGRCALTAYRLAAGWGTGMPPFMTLK
jgi:sugar lactone lactonase YvrE